jgi:hypothetical protein
VAELLESAGGIAALAVAVVLLGFAAYWAFGPQAIGLPTIIGLFALWGLIKLVSNAGLGPVGILVVAGGLFALLLIIGMAMRLGGDPSTRTDADRAGEEPRDASER